MPTREQPVLPVRHSSVSHRAAQVRQEQLPPAVGESHDKLVETGPSQASLAPTSSPALALKPKRVVSFSSEPDHTASPPRSASPAAGARKSSLPKGTLDEREAARVALDSSVSLLRQAADMATAASATVKSDKAPASALKRSSQASRELPPKELYSHPDPLLRRLRLRDGYGKEVNLKSAFRDCIAVAFYFDASWGRRGAMSTFASDVIRLTRVSPHRLKVVYVSIDTTEESYESNSLARGWLSMEWNDGSNLAVGQHEDAVDPINLSRGEDFLLAGEVDTEDHLGDDDDQNEELYTRPYARVHLAAKWMVLGIPQLVVYHIPSRKILSRHVRPRQIDKDRVEQTVNRWLSGETNDAVFMEVVHQLKYTFALLILAVLYVLWVRSGGTDPIAALIELFSNGHQPALVHPEL
ncbi:uncharacterized protein L969DRAFT_332827 [Mixia osmundae IAM 14324]|uniref:Thioredoxin-like fold domain-containing protein n=1 Tax=Mixia osmundae (strain CBS 9802 / IAM 14324 / JCM 22182 / KY 12970) TaxID=764103 RepID=G7E6E0_MIXOS|nr:uncharacterized protein L969DRAFT_332827 [Mixia osmundae IAM 14324]KEI40443.1 hypothetical protein L969DRAFT_332827 [Mixia osmundae IAM 14324]GAA98400.1 hypothetical protein E5Q_05086 [Mixia osmundae IAM 14324]